jgi:hypothetical protein
MLGKIVTVLQLVALVAVLVIPTFTTPMVIGIGILSVAAIADYTVALWRARAR